jgi:hypothetical protein
MLEAVMIFRRFVRSGTPKGPAVGASILVADDEPNIVLSLEFVLKHYVYCC